MDEKAFEAWKKEQRQRFAKFRAEVKENLTASESRAKKRSKKALKK